MPRGRMRRTSGESRAGSGLWACPEPPGAEQGRAVGVARDVHDVILLVRRHGVVLEREDLDRSPLVEWRGGDSAALGLSESASS